MKKNGSPTVPVASAPRADRIAIDLAMPRIDANVRIAHREREHQPQT
ncbi:MAG: hypothetical protein JXP34_06255 [Planctomycetes bacterium]|nr:hypothetical protein [Planctomycetota bacterium]